MDVQLDDSRPTYLQVADALREEIRRGDIGPGDRLASVRDLSARFEIAAVTVQSALRVLRDEGYIASRSTRGYFVREELPPAVDELPSAEFTALREQLEALTASVRGIGERVTELEAVVLPEGRRDQSPGTGPRSAG